MPHPSERHAFWVSQRTQPTGTSGPASGTHSNMPPSWGPAARSATFLQRQAITAPKAVHGRPSSALAIIPGGLCLLTRRLLSFTNGKGVTSAGPESS